MNETINFFPQKWICMKQLLLLGLTVFCVHEGYAQKRRPKPVPPPSIADVPPPPEPKPPLEETLKLNADPLQEHATTFWTDTLYRYTDSSFQVELWYFSPENTSQARLSKNIYPYPKRYTKDSLVQHGNRVLAESMEMHFQDGAYSYDKKPPKEAGKIIFTDEETKQRTVFKIIWKGKGAHKTIAALKDEATNTLWKPGDPPAAAPVGF